MLTINAIRSVDISDDGQIVVAANQKAEIFVWNPETSMKFKEVTR